MERKFVYQDDGVVRRTMFADDATPDKFGIFTEQNTPDLFANNVALADAHPRRSTNKLVARVPIQVYEQAIREGWDDDDWKKFLNDPANKNLRVWQGRV